MAGSRLALVTIGTSATPTLAERIERLDGTYHRYREAGAWIAAAATAWTVAMLLEDSGDLVRASRWETRRNECMQRAEAHVFRAALAEREIAALVGAAP
jgi:hypothetical protein